MLEPPKNIEAGQPFASSLLSKMREILVYLDRSRLIPGQGIRMMEAPCGIEISVDTVRRTSPAVSSRKREEYTAPWSLTLYERTISAKTGLIWTPDGTVFSSTDIYCDKPSGSSLIVLSLYNGQPSISAMVGSMQSVCMQQDRHFWDTHAILGKYDAENNSVIQYHFSPIVFMIETEEFTIAP